jgi:dTDP-4-dehydrorhamnose reductase
VNESPGSDDQPNAARTRPVLLTGASGLLGQWLSRTAPRGADVIALTHRDSIPDIPQVHADLRDGRSTMTAVKHADPSLVIHAAYAHDRAAIVDATANVVAAAGEVDADVVVISTDAVFCGDGIARDEASVPDAVWDYGRWKAQAERVALQRSATAAIVRLPLLVSFDPDDHVVREIRTSAARDETTQWFTDETRQPALAREVAAAIWRIADLVPGARAGPWHLAGAERLTRYEIASRVVQQLGLGRNVVDAVTTPKGAVRPRDIVCTDVRARVEVDWSPSPVLRYRRGSVVK